MAIAAGAAGMPRRVAAVRAGEAGTTTWCGRPGFSGHPEPRPGIDGSAVLDAAEVRPGVAELFDGIREIPHVADGLGCHCGCGAMPDMRSLLSCYEGVGMAQFCVICEGEGRLAVQLHAEGKSLDEIRAAIDRRFRG